MLNYDIARSYAEGMDRDMRMETVIVGWDGRPIRTLASQYAELEGCLYEILTDVYMTQHGFDPTFTSLTEEYIRHSIPRIDALTLWYGMTGHPTRRDTVREWWRTSADLFDAGLAEWIDSYLAGVSLEHILA